jgi:hypothetical protein
MAQLTTLLLIPMDLKGIATTTGTPMEIHGSVPFLFFCCCGFWKLGS